MSLELVIFDVDGLLLDTESVWQKAWQLIGKKYNIERLSDEVFYKCVGHTGTVVEAIMLEELKDQNDPLAILDDVRETGMKLLEQELEVKPGARELIAYLKAHGVKVAVGTSTKRELNDERLKRVDLFDEFCYILCGNEVSKRKPDPEMYNTIVDCLGVEKNHALILEDSHLGVEAAYRAGIPCIMVPDLLLATDIQKKQAIYIAKSLLDAKAYIENNQWI
ncbi:hypothetical protein A4S06_09295 [Erysipelotrichaceae bacterium MTC7]|nr:hypothetical protein A4S06_09295 [Erysipelotrichaceae bacterium MTC7]